jgi:hypothetical protein
MKRFSHVKAILEEAVSVEDIGAHGNFWRNQTRDEFVALSVFGRPLLAKKADGSFDDNESNLVKALEARAPFGNDVGTPGATIPRMPKDRDPVPTESIAFIRQWIKDGCPDDAP